MAMSFALESFGDAPRRSKEPANVESDAAEEIPIEETEAYRLGFEAGQAEAERRQTVRLEELAAERAVFAAQLAQALAARRGAEAAAETRALDLLRAVIARFAPRLATTGFAELAVAATGDWLARLAVSRATLRVAPDRVAAVRDELTADAILAATLDLAADDALAPGAARLEWPGGVAELDLERALDALMTTLDGLAAAAQSRDDAVGLDADEAVETRADDRPAEADEPPDAVEQDGAEKEECTDHDQ